MSILPGGEGRTNPWWRRTTPSCSPDELSQIIVAPSGGYYQLPTDPFNEVFPGIYIGDGTTALCTSLLKRLGVTDVLNAACGKDRHLNLINTSQGFYREAKIRFLGIEALDMSSFRLYPFFEEAAEFIQEALQRGGKVYVHCRQGISRSSTLVLAFLISRRGYTAQEAVREVRRQREIIPNDGFLQQLCELNENCLTARRRTGRLTDGQTLSSAYSYNRISVL